MGSVKISYSATSFVTFYCSIFGCFIHVVYYWALLHTDDTTLTCVLDLNNHRKWCSHELVKKFQGNVVVVRNSLASGQVHLPHLSRKNCPMFFLGECCVHILLGPRHRLWRCPCWNDLSGGRNRFVRILQRWIQYTKYLGKKNRTKHFVQMSNTTQTKHIWFKDEVLRQQKHHFLLSTYLKPLGGKTIFDFRSQLYHSEFRLHSPLLCD